MTKDMVERYLPPAADDTLIMVCGTDGFLDTVCGGKERIDMGQGRKKKKVQGPVNGLLRSLGYQEHMVYKM